MDDIEKNEQEETTEKVGPEMDSEHGEGSAVEEAPEVALEHGEGSVEEEYSEADLEHGEENIEEENSSEVPSTEDDKVPSDPSPTTEAEVESPPDREKGSRHKNSVKEAFLSAGGNLHIGDKIFTEQRINEKDPTTKYILREPLFELTKKDFDGFKVSSITFISCHHEEVSIDAVNQVIRQEKKEGNKINFRFLPSHEEGKSRRIYQLFHGDNKILLEDNYVLVIDQGNIDLLNSVNKTSKGTLGNLIRSMGEKNIRVFFLCKGGLSKVSEVFPLEKEKCSLWPIDFLPPLLKNKGCEELISIIRKQQELGLWKKDEQLFYEEISTHLNEGVDKLADHVELLASYDPSVGSIRTFLKEKVETIDHELVLKLSLANSYVVFAVTFFPKLSLNQFNRLIVILFQEDKITVEQVTKKGKRIEKKIRLKKLWQDFEKGSDYILGECHVRNYFEEDSGREYIDFTEPYLRAKYTSYFNARGRNQLQRFFARVRYSLIYFEKGTKGDFLNSLTRLSVKMATKDPEEFGVNRLVSLINDCVYKEKEKVSDPNFSISVIKQLIKKDNVNWLVYRVSNLAYAMVETPQLEAIVNSLLGHYIGKGDHEIVYKLIRYLHYSDAFDTFEWLRKLINTAHPEVRWNGYKLLLEIALDKPEEIFDILEDLKNKWAPDDDRNFSRYSVSSHAYYSFVLDAPLCIGVDDPGLYPITYPFFLRSGETETKLLPKEEAYISLLFSQATAKSFDTFRSLVQKKNAEKHPVKFVNVLHRWYLVIFGSPKVDSAGRTAFYQEILRTIKGSLDVEELVEFYEAFSSIEELLLGELYSLDAKEPRGELQKEKKKEEILECKTLLSQLSHILQELKKA